MAILLKGCLLIKMGGGEEIKNQTSFTEWEIATWIPTTTAKSTQTPLPRLPFLLNHMPLHLRTETQTTNMKHEKKKDPKSKIPVASLDC